MNRLSLIPSTWSAGMDPGVIRTPVVTGNDKLRIDYNQFSRDYSIGWQLDVVEYGQFIAFLKNEGAGWFEISVPAAGRTDILVVRAAGPINASKIGHDQYQVSGSFHAQGYAPGSDLPIAPSSDWIVGGTPPNPSPDWYVGGSPRAPSVDWVFSGFPPTPSALI